MYKILIVFLLITAGCTKTVTEFTVKTSFKTGERILVLKPEISGKAYYKSAEEALSGSVTANLGNLGFNYLVVWDAMPPVYGKFFNRIHELSRDIFSTATNNIEKAGDKKDYKDEFIANLDLLGTRFNDALKKKQFGEWTPQYILVTGIVYKGSTFSGSLKLWVYGVLIDRVSRNVVWGHAFDTRCGANQERMTVAAINSGKILAVELTNWVKKSTIKSSK